ncbi:MAG TPA: PDZ domain-containing protein [Candidatus Polarisedimenticolia bacterium]|nr:PDZ domain-containing protein [Candidatus Polarisedimenticolia bacterium]
MTKKMTTAAVAGAVGLISLAAVLAAAPAPPAPPAPPAQVAHAAPPAPPAPETPEPDEGRGSRGRGPRGAWLGIIMSDEGRVDEVMDDSPAEAAGLKRGDRIIELDGKEIEDASDVRSAVRRLEPGDTLKIRVDRDGSEKTLTATVGERPWSRRAPMVWQSDDDDDDDEEGQPSAHSHSHTFVLGGSSTFIGVELHPMSKDLRAYFKAPRDTGILVNRVIEDTPAERAGMKAGDVIIAVDGHDVSDHGDIGEALSDHEAGDTVVVRVLRDGSEKSFDVKLADRPGFRHHRGSFTPEAFEVPEINLESLNQLDSLKSLESLKDLQVFDEAKMAKLHEKIAKEVERAMEAAREAQEQAIQDGMKLKHKDVIVIKDGSSYDI